MGHGKTLYLAKANDDLLSWCGCDEARITWPLQMDCPWCGCGWLFTCLRCRKAFTFAVATEVDLGWEELARQDLAALYRAAPPADHVEQWVEFMRVMLGDLQPGGIYVYLDGWVFPRDKRDFSFEGWHSRHDIGVLPHAAALDDRSVLDRTLRDVEYWQSRQIRRSS